MIYTILQKHINDNPILKAVSQTLEKKAIAAALRIGYKPNWMLSLVRFLVWADNKITTRYERNNIAKIEAAKKLAPFYLILKDDGADFKCSECGLSQRSTKYKPFVIIYTPNGIRHSAVHLECLDEDWVKNARYMGEI